MKNFTLLCSLLSFIVAIACARYYIWVVRDLNILWWAIGLTLLSYALVWVNGAFTGFNWMHRLERSAYVHRSREE